MPAAGRILVVGNGAREHAIVWTLRHGSNVEQIFCAPGNGGTALVAENVAIPANQVDRLASWSAANQIDFVIVGPEEPLALGLVDRLQARGIAAFGPTAAAARIESSKSWAKDILHDAGVATAAHAAFTDPSRAWDYARAQSYPIVLKADGLAAGKGVVIAQSPDEARATISAALEQGAFGQAGQTLLIEEFLVGDEVSLLAFVDGTRVAPLAPARDHKRALDGDRGPNTGGMGAIAPTRLVKPADIADLSASVLEPVVAAMRARGVNYRGVLYAGLILTADGPRVLEFNCRLGDPETQVILPLLDDDLLELTRATANGQLGRAELTLHPEFRCGGVLASGGYPDTYETGFAIDGIDQVEPGALVFQAGTRRTENGALVTDGGRVLTVVGHGATLELARDEAYRNVDRIHFSGAQFRRDIGARESWH